MRHPQREKEDNLCGILEEIWGKIKKNHCRCELKLAETGSSRIHANHQKQTIGGKDA